MKLNIVFLSMLLAGPALAQEAKPQEITAIDVRNEAPKFEREYRIKLNNFISMKITCKNSEYASLYPSGRACSGQLDQMDGKWVMFDPDSPADQILDKELLPSIRKFVAQIHAADIIFAHSAHTEFIDKDGKHWQLEHPAVAKK